MPDYNHGNIYTSRCKTDDSLIYVGGTTQSLSERMASHRCDCKRRPNICFYEYVDVWDNWYIELFEYFPCNNKEELNKKEGQVLREIGTINKQVAGRTDKEWHKDNKEKILERRKENYDNNKDKILQSHKEYVNKNKDEIKEYKKEYANRNKEKIAEEKKKEYANRNKEKMAEENYQQNKEKRKEYLKLYRETNKEIKAEQRKKIYDETKQTQQIS
jgi:hypothetical protein